MSPTVTLRILWNQDKNIIVLDILTYTDLFLRFGLEGKKKEKSYNSNFVLLEREKGQGVFSSLVPPFSTERYIKNSIFYREREGRNINHRSSCFNREKIHE